MIKINKDYNLKIASLIIAGIFLLTKAVYGIELSVRSYLRVPSIFTTKEGKSRLGDGIITVASEENRAQNPIAEKADNKKPFKELSTEEQTILEKNVLKEVFSLWAQGFQYAPKIVDSLSYLGFQASLRFPDETYFQYDRKEGAIREAVLGNIGKHSDWEKHLYFIRENALGMEVLVLDFGKGVVDYDERPQHDLSHIFDSGHSYHFGGPPNGFGMAHIAQEAEIVRIGSMNDRHIIVVDRGERLWSDGLFSQYSTKQTIYKLDDVGFDANGSGFFYHFFIRKNPWDKGRVDFSACSVDNLFGTVLCSERKSDLQTKDPMYLIEKGDEVTINFRESEYKNLCKGIYRGILLSDIDLSAGDRTFKIRLTHDDSYDHKAPKRNVGEVIELQNNEVKLLSIEPNRPEEDIESFSKFQTEVKRLNIRWGSELRIVFNVEAKTKTHQGIIIEKPDPNNGFKICFGNLAISPNMVEDIEFHRSNNILTLQDLNKDSIAGEKGTSHSLLTSL